MVKHLHKDNVNISFACLLVFVLKTNESLNFDSFAQLCLRKTISGMKFLFHHFVSQNLLPILGHIIKQSQLNSI